MKRIKSQIFFRREKESDPSIIKLNLGCGEMYLPGWVNVDVDSSVRPDLVCGFQDLHTNFKKDSVSEILMLHSISYLRLWEARIFLKQLYVILKSDGLLTMEFPDILKCSEAMLKTTDYDQYIEAVRGVYAFDLDQIRNKELYTPYAFGWTGWHLQQELTAIGFKHVEIIQPESHGKRVWRDTRVTARK